MAALASASGLRLDAFAAAPALARDPGFRLIDVTAAAGIHFRHNSGAYGGKLLPSFPSWVIDGQKPSRLAWMLKERMLPFVYWKAMLRGREWMATPELVG